MTTTTPTVPTGSAATRRLQGLAHVVLAVVAATGAALSYESLYSAAAVVFDGSPLAFGFPLLVDALVLGASLQYVAGCRTRSAGRHGWRATAHAGIAGTLILNALAADTPAEVPWHVVAPAAWAVLVELYARTAAWQWKNERPETDTIPVRLWVTAPVESARTWLRQARLGAAVAARFDTGRHAGAAEALRLTLPGPSGRRVRRVLARQLRAGSLTPDAVLVACGWHHTQPARRLDPTTVLRAALIATPDPTRADRVAVGAAQPDCAGRPAIGSGPAGSVGSIGLVTPIRSGRDRMGDREQTDRWPVGADRAGTGRQATTVKAPARPSPPTITDGPDTGGRVARREDLEHVRALIASGDLPAAPSAEAIRRALGIGLPYARAARDALGAAAPGGNGGRNGQHHEALQQSH